MPPETDRDLRPVWADLHIHTVVSPCAEVEMIPPLIIRRARELGLGLIAITDHNTAENVQAVQLAAEGSGITVLPGMEVQTREEVHLLCLFDTLEQVLRWQEVVYARSSPLKNREEVFGAQYVVDEKGEYRYTNDRLLLASTSLSVDDVVEGVRQEGGLSIAAHVDRQAFGLLAVLGFVPPGLALAALELWHSLPDDTGLGGASLVGWPITHASDAHRLSEMRASTLVVVREPTIHELALAFRGQDGRKVKLLP
jgi:hypothetical protein